MGAKVDPNVYRIISVLDGLALDVRGGRTENGVDVITFKYHNANNQHWRASLDDGGVILYSVNQPSSSSKLRVLEMSLSGLVQIYDHRNSQNQKWFIEEIDENQKTYVIRNLANSCCLQNNGQSKQVSVSAGKVLPCHVWRIEKV